MKKFILSICLLIAGIGAQAQISQGPGLYAINGNDTIKLTVLNGNENVSESHILGVDIQNHDRMQYNEIISDTPTSGSDFLMVIDPNKKVAKGGVMTDYEPFIKTVKPELLMLVPLEVENDKERRIFNLQENKSALKIKAKNAIEFTWDQVSDSAWIIHTPQLVPGEYAFLVRTTKLDQFDFQQVLDFTKIGNF